MSRRVLRRKSGTSLRCTARRWERFEILVTVAIAGSGRFSPVKWGGASAAKSGAQSRTHAPSADEGEAAKPISIPLVASARSGTLGRVL
jgi:hypothetical protein